jgi:hypothetical protein
MNDQLWKHGLLLGQASISVLTSCILGNDEGVDIPFAALFR